MSKEFPQAAVKVVDRIVIENGKPIQKLEIVEPIRNESSLPVRAYVVESHLS